MNPRDRLKALLAEAAALHAKGADNLSDADIERVPVLKSEIDTAQAAVDKLDATAKALAGFGSLIAKTEDGADPAPVGGLSMDGEGAGSLGLAFIKSESFREFRKSYAQGHAVDKRPVKIEKAVIGPRDIRKADPAPLNSQAVGGPYWLPTRLPGITDLTYRKPTTLLDIITHGTTATPFVAYRQLVSITNNAAIVPEGTKKPLSSLSFDTAQATAVTYADGFKVTNQELADDGIIASLLDSVLTKNLALLVEDMVLNGTGAAGQPEGILHTSGVLAQAFDTDVFTTVLRAITQLRLTANATVEAIVMNPQDVTDILLAKDANDRFYGAGPFALTTPPLWGVPIVQSSKVVAGTAIAGDFTTVQLLQLDPLAIEAFNQNEDDARNNLTYIRAEERALLLNREPAKLCTIDLTA